MVRADRERCPTQASRAREGLLAGGDLATAGYTYYPTAYDLLDCAPTLDEYIAEMEAALAFVRPDRQRADPPDGSSATGGWRVCCAARRSFVAGEAVRADQYADNPSALFFAHVNSAVAADGVRRPGRPGPAHRGGDAAAAGRPGSLPDRGGPPAARPGSRRGRSATADGDAATSLLAALDEVTRWLAARAADAPENFLHLLRLVEAERAWAVGDFRAAALAFDAARARSPAVGGRGTGR